MCEPKWKKRLLAVLVLCFVVQSSLVYSDERHEPLSEEALAGRALWHRHACQTCHQFYGQGGFLGPDLTNAASRVDSTRLASLLKVGSGQMPALALADAEIAELSAFLGAMDRPEIGRGQLRLGSEGQGGLQAGFETAVAERLPEAGAAAAAGFDLVRTRVCSACHYPFRASPVGAPDLSTATSRLTADSLDLVLTSGRPLKGMPPPIPPLAPDERAAIAAYLAFLAAERDELDARMQALAGDRRFDWRDLPWWEFP
ncbi:MAG: c-type cytochrome [Gemmatimonadota bacterium]|nr:c-type cytochrome [Gemmatimonadota bacterium]